MTVDDTRSTLKTRPIELSVSWDFQGNVVAMAVSCKFTVSNACTVPFCVHDYIHIYIYHRRSITVRLHVPKTGCVGCAVVLKATLLWMWSCTTVLLFMTGIYYKIKLYVYVPLSLCVCVCVCACVRVCVWHLIAEYNSIHNKINTSQQQLRTRLLHLLHSTNTWFICDT